ncbi:hypothetical protein IWQ60_006812 [Tieghemiomyces parasiticus]|uniref:Uncharacterized protein n=1 Tax=Tieghemiomyces parasiticus TaxID=78921 RepID=A0A9W8DWL8_9FUNG|nr:hypothetical protein IWQ60_006812 [Tieghemiomyces parasiticus]
MFSPSRFIVYHEVLSPSSVLLSALLEAESLAAPTPDSLESSNYGHGGGSYNYDHNKSNRSDENSSAVQASGKGRNSSFNYAAGAGSKGYNGYERTSERIQSHTSASNYGHTQSNNGSQNYKYKAASTHGRSDSAYDPLHSAADGSRFANEHTKADQSCRCGPQSFENTKASC